MMVRRDILSPAERGRFGLDDIDAHDEEAYSFGNVFFSGRGKGCDVDRVKLPVALPASVDVVRADSAVDDDGWYIIVALDFSAYGDVARARHLASGWLHDCADELDALEWPVEVGPRSLLAAVDGGEELGIIVDGTDAKLAWKSARDEDGRVRFAMATCGVVNSRAEATAPEVQSIIDDAALALDEPEEESSAITEDDDVEPRAARDALTLSIDEIVRAPLDSLLPTLPSHAWECDVPELVARFFTLQLPHAPLALLCTVADRRAEQVHLQDFFNSDDIPVPFASEGTGDQWVLDDDDDHDDPWVYLLGPDYRERQTTARFSQWARAVLIIVRAGRLKAAGAVVVADDVRQKIESFAPGLLSMGLDLRVSVGALEPRR